jgi:hypothetical protein
MKTSSCRADTAARAAVFSLAVMASLAACTNPLRATIVKSTSDYQVSNLQVLAAGSPIQSGYGIDKAANIVFEFSQGMGASMVSVGGDFAAESKAGVWSTRKVAQDTLTLAPASGAWKAGSQKTLTLQFTSGATTATGLSYTLGILDGVVYVSDGAGSDAWPGTADMPKKTIPAAIANAALFYSAAKPAEVHVARGTYAVTYTLGTHVIMKPGISLLGSYSLDWSTRSIAPPTSTIVDKSVGAITGTMRAVDCGTGLGMDTKLDGFVVQGGGNSNTVASEAIYCSSSGPTISNIIGTGGYGSTSVAIYISSSTPFVTNCSLDGGYGVDSVGIETSDSGSGCVIRTNTITGGQGGNSCRGIVNSGDSQGASAPIIQGNTITASNSTTNEAVGIDNITSNALIEGNFIRAGSFYSGALNGDLGYGIGISAESASSAVIRNNVIVGGESQDTGLINATGIGISLSGQGAIIQNNTICGGLTEGSGSMSIGIYLGAGTVGADSPIENNIIFTLSGASEYGIAQSSTGLNSTSFNNNLIFDCTSLYTIGVSSAPSVILTQDNINSYWPEGMASGNITTNSPNSVFNALKGPSDTSVGADWSLPTGSPAKGAGTDLSSQGFSTDITGTARTDPWSIGAYQ